MWKNFLQLLKPPHFVDEDKTRAAEVLHVILLSLFIVLGVLAFFTDHPVTSLVTAGMSLSFLGLWLIMRRGLVNLASWCLMVFLVIGITLIVYFNGSIRIPAASGFVACIVVAGLTLGNRATIASAIAISGILLVLYLAEVAGKLPPVYYQETGFLQWATYAGIMCITAVLLMLARNSILSALALARRNEAALAERNQQLRAEIAERRHVEHALRESEGLYRTLVATSPDGIAQTDIRGNIIYASPQLLSLFHLSSPEQILETNVIDWIMPEDRQRAIENVRYAMSDNPTAYNSYTFLRKDGSQFAVEISSAAWKNAEDQTGGMISTVRDVTERLRVERVLRESEERYRTLFELESDAIVLIDMESRKIWDVNPAAMQLYGYSREEFLLMNPLDLSAEPEKDRQIVRSGDPAPRVPLRYARNKEGKVFPIEATACYFDWQGKKHMLITARDITERVRTEDSLREYRERLEELVEERTAQLTAINQELESFSYSVAHDLRVPLRAINGFSQILLEDYSSRFDSEMLSYFNQIIAAGQRMNQLIDALLGLSRLTRSEITREEIDLGAMAHTVLEELHQREPARNVDVKISDGLIIKADRHLMRLVLENLLGNAWKFTAKSSNPCIELGRQDDDKDAYFVRDNGAGFNMEYAGKLFGPFQRLHTEKEFPGTGIGLATVKRIIHRHGGEVWATGEIDKGATFYFTLP